MTVVAGIFIINKKHEILLAHPTNHKPDFWSMLKGAVEEGEHQLEAALRETFEECNVRLTKKDRFYALQPKKYRSGKKLLYPYVILESENSFESATFDLKCNSFVPEEKGGFPEMDDYRWFSMAEAEKVMHEAQVACLDEIKQILRK